MIAGSLWLIRIGAGEDDPDRTFWRFHGKARDSRLAWIPGAPEPPTWRWLATRAGMAFGAGAVVVALVGPLVMTRWDRVLEDALVLAAPAWALAVMAAAVGSVWLVRVARRGLEDGPSRWRYRR